MHFMETLSFVSPNLNVLEGCLHQYTAGQEFPGTVLSSGTEDFFDSGWYFSAGQFRLPVSGLTHLEKGNGECCCRCPSPRWPLDHCVPCYAFATDNNMYSSMYRFHNTDPLQFADGFELVWRIGDTVDAAGRKCFVRLPARVLCWVLDTVDAGMCRWLCADKLHDGQARRQSATDQRHRVCVDVRVVNLQ